MVALVKAISVAATVFSIIPHGISAVPSSYAVWAANSAIARGQGNGLINGSPRINYEHGEFQWALRRLYELTGNKTYFDYIKLGADTILSDGGGTIAGYV